MFLHAPGVGAQAIPRDSGRSEQIWSTVQDSDGMYGFVAGYF